MDLSETEVPQNCMVYHHVFSQKLNSKQIQIILLVVNPILFTYLPVKPPFLLAKKMSKKSKHKNVSAIIPS